MNIQFLNNCCSTVYLYGFLESDHRVSSKQLFWNFLLEEKASEMQAIIYINDYTPNKFRLKRLGFRRKCRYIGADTERKAAIYILDLRKFRKSLYKKSFKDKLKKFWKDFKLAFR